ncbi:MAG: glutaredoxin domain-containing protein [Chloroflexota bacterium]|nr:glutaredoxin domain-containing protein [Chloroflexota bacterium]MDP6508414.1 glutaredoxin domain-containing protein [Chloroflexota bacterium]MDP6758353.1 glutaredoxin domain-containing protein [Chloroflexota bacterium]
MAEGTDITLYGVEWCPWVRRARNWLESHGLPYEWVVVPDAQWERQEVVAVSGQMEVPVIVVAHDGQRHVFLEETHPDLPGLLNL